MNTTKKLLVLIMVAVMAAVSVVPSTFSWYSHKGELEGKKVNLHYNDLPVSYKSDNDTISMTTVESDANGTKSSTSVTRVNLPADSGKALKYYMTTITNTGANDVNIDLNMSNLLNNADFVIGTLSPTLNERAFASRAARTKKSNSTTRIYFKTHPSMSSYWGVDNGTLEPESNSHPAGNNSTTNDINIAYLPNGASTEEMKKMNKCPNSDNNNIGNNSTNVYYYDIPSDAEYFYFFNHWYLKSSTNREWNQTKFITDTTTKGRLYYLTGQKTEGDYKEYQVTSVIPNLVGLNSYYDTVRMSLGDSVFADISLKKESDEADFVPEYLGKTITYKVQDDGSSYASVNGDGLITPKAAGTATIRTRITGEFGDYIETDTTVNIPTSINQVPIIQNVVVPHGADNKVDIHWYVINKSSSVAMTTDSIFFTF